MSDNDILIFSRILHEIKYDPNTDRKSKRREYISDKLPSRVQKVLKPPIATIACGESDEYKSLESDIEGIGVKKQIVVVPEDSDEMWTRLQVLLGLKQARHWYPQRSFTIAWCFIQKTCDRERTTISKRYW